MRVIGYHSGLVIFLLQLLLRWFCARAFLGIVFFFFFFMGAWVLALTLVLLFGLRYFLALR